MRFHQDDKKDKIKIQKEESYKEKEWINEEENGLKEEREEKQKVN